MGLVIFLALVGSFMVDMYSGDKKTETETTKLLLPTLTENKIRVAIMADIHGDREQLEKMLFMAKENENELVIVAGDLIDKEEGDGLIKIKTILDNSGLKYAVIPGDREKNLTVFKNVFGKDYQSIEIGRVKFILINNALWHGLGAEQKKWIETVVKDCNEKVCLAVMHKPLNNLFSVKVMGEGNEKVMAEAKWLVQLLVKSGVKRIEAADLHYSTSYELEGIRTDIVGAISRFDNLQSSRYTELMIDHNSIERRVVEEENDTGN